VIGTIYSKILLSQAPEDQVLVGNLIGEDHVNYVLMYNISTGICITVSDK
jgi:1-phosphatidylinositol-4-phosphate 5-kinase